MDQVPRAGRYKVLQRKKILSSEAVAYMDRFDGVTLPHIIDLLEGKPAIAPYNQKHTEFAVALFYHSSKAYAYLHHISS